MSERNQARARVVDGEIPAALDERMGVACATGGYSFN